MPHMYFACDERQAIAGCVERICCYTPWTGPSQLRKRDGSVVQVGALERTWGAVLEWAAKHGYVMAQSINYEPMITNKLTDQGNQFVVYCVQEAKPQTQQTQVNAPYGVPFGGRVALTEPPVQQPQGAPRAVPQGCYEDLSEAALPRGPGDGLMAEMDGEGGTYSDIDATTGTERVRFEFMPASKPPQQMIGQ